MIGFIAGRMCRLVEVQDPVHVAVVGDGDPRLAVFGRPLHDLVNPCCPVEHGELRVEVQVCKRLAHLPIYLLLLIAMRAINRAL